MKFQFVWHKEFHIGLWIPEFSWRYIYDWSISLGFLEIRKWSTRRIH